jgi:nucleotide-binding universal stress UspA family protein
MRFKDILVALTTYPEPTTVAAVEDAIDIAAALGAGISAVACEIRVQAPGSVLGNALLNVPALAAAESRKSAINAQNLLESFQRSAARRGVYVEGRLEHCLFAQVHALLVGHARLCDLTIVPSPPPGVLHQPYAESIIFGSGRPTLVTPHGRARDKAFALDTIVVAWDYSRPAARVVADALPMLARARQVHVVTVTNEKAIDTWRSSADLARHLARHDIDAAMDTVDAGGRGIGEVLRAYAGSRDADLLVMGAYGHSRVREFVLGGATRSLLAQPPIPILLSH